MPLFYCQALPALPVHHRTIGRRFCQRVSTEHHCSRLSIQLLCLARKHAEFCGANNVAQTLASGRLGQRRTRGAALPKSVWALRCAMQLTGCWASRYLAAFANLRNPLFRSTYIMFCNFGEATSSSMQPHLQLPLGLCFTC